MPNARQSTTECGSGRDRDESRLALRTLFAEMSAVRFAKLASVPAKLPSSLSLNSFAQAALRASSKPAKGAMRVKCRWDHDELGDQTKAA